MTISVVGTGFVGVVTAAVFASFGHTVHGLDVDSKKISNLKRGKAPFYEPHLDQLIQETQKKGTLQFTTSYSEAIPPSNVIIIAVGTPSLKSGGVDLQYLLAAIKSMAPYVSDKAIIAIKSTVPPHAVEKVQKVLSKHVTVSYQLATIPEFLREGSAVRDTLHPARIVIGVEKSQTYNILEELHKPFNAPIIQTKLASAQMAKYAANAYLATRITFINQIADLCEKNEADVLEVIKAIGFDPRIGDHYWYPGLGYGGSCFPKDVKELAYFSRQVGEADNLFNKLRELNEQRLSRLYQQFTQFVGGWQGKTVAVLGLAFKPNTDDVREAPSTKLVPAILKEGARVKAFDPKATLEQLPEIAKYGTQYTEKNDPASTCSNVDVLLLITEWPEITSFDFTSVREDKEQWVIDTRNQLDKELLLSAGYHYRGIGRGGSQ